MSFSDFGLSDYLSSFGGTDSTGATQSVGLYQNEVPFGLNTAFSTPIQSPTPNSGGGNLFSDILGGIGQGLRETIPQFTTTLLQRGGQNLINDTFKGSTNPPTTAQATSIGSVFSNPQTWMVIGGVLVIGLGAFFLLKK